MKYCEYYICYFNEKGVVGKEIESELHAFEYIWKSTYIRTQRALAVGVSGIHD